MDIGKIVKWLVIGVCLLLLFRAGKRWMDSSSLTQGGLASPSISSCPATARLASGRWGSGIGRFVNPPYDLSEWQRFHDEVMSGISSAESECRCSSESCRKAAGAMSELRSLVSDLDSSIRNGSSPPSDVVRRQESIDGAIDDAAGLAGEGK